ncbi:hypothetical protein ACJRO7_006769 [Eucalyptus globulus]|uniref:PGG domain-containing protein n=1 Tax=Eucalyptus globulus TaxID=34317 RepID=A0ABD3IMW9_EUCGL
MTSKDVNGNTPLHLASMHNHCPVLLTLTRDNRDALKLLNNDKLTALDVAMESESLSTKYSPLQGRAILIAAGIPRTKGRDIWSPRKQSSVVSKSPRTKGTSDDINTPLVVATLVASVTFTAGITLPGGYNSSSDRHPGTAILQNKKVFQLFMISDMLAIYSSILAFTFLLWSYVSAGPSLFVALTSMSVAFLAAAIVAVSKLSWLLTWLWILVLCITVVYLTMLIMVFIALMFPFSKAAMRAMSLYYLVPAQPGYAVPQIVKMHWQTYRNRGVPFLFRILFPLPAAFLWAIDDLILRLIFNS